MPINQCTQAQEQLRRVEEAIQAVQTALDATTDPAERRPLREQLTRLTARLTAQRDQLRILVNEVCAPASAGVTARAAAPPRRLGPKRTAAARKAEKAARKASARYHKAVAKYAADLEKSAAGLMKALGAKEKKKAGAKKKAVAKKKTG